MDARLAHIVALFALLFATSTAVHGQSPVQVVTTNFVVRAPDKNVAGAAAKLAEQYRKDLSIEWLGYEIKPWSEKCPITIELQPLPGGETSFAFVPNGDRGQPIGWRMKVFGPPDRVLDAVLPHEITHTIFATHFGRPLPRWADEGACTTVEHESERAKNHQMLIQFLTAKPSRGIPFNRMFTMKEYPHDILPLYAQGHSLAKYLIAQKGKRHFVKYIGAGMELGDKREHLAAWTAATKKSYGYDSLSDLQIDWLKWVERGSPTDASRSEIAANTNSPKSDLVGTRQAEIASFEKPRPPIVEPLAELAQSNGNVRGSWYRQQMIIGAAKPPAGNSPEERAIGQLLNIDCEPFLPGSTKAVLGGSILRKPPATHLPARASD